MSGRMLIDSKPPLGRNSNDLRMPDKTKSQSQGNVSYLSLH